MVAVIPSTACTTRLSPTYSPGLSRTTNDRCRSVIWMIGSAILPISLLLR